MSERRNNIVIFYLSVGSGHQMAAYALYTTFQKFFQKFNQNYNLIFFDPFFNDRNSYLLSTIEQFNAVSRTLFSLLYDIVWHKGIPFSKYITGLGLLRKNVVKAIHRFKPKAIISMHALPCIISTEIVDHVPIYGVLTDYGLHAFWPRYKVAGYFVPHEEIKNILVYHGYPEHQIFSTGIPLRPDFIDVTEKASIINGGPLRVLIFGGAYTKSGYHIFEDRIISIIKDSLSNNLNNIQFTIVVGHNKKLKQRLNRIISSSSVQIQGFVHEVVDLYLHHDIVLSKPGGLTIAESLATGTPLLLLGPSVGQERANEEFLARHRAALPIYTSEQGLKTLSTFLNHPELLKVLKKNAFALGKPKASLEILDIVFSKIYVQ